MKRIKKQSGVAFMEYVVIVGALVATFAVIGLLLKFTAAKIAKRSVDTVRFDVPCTDEERAAAAASDGKILMKDDCQ